MGLSSNQARFLSLTARQIDVEQRLQQICQRRLRLSSELENVATSYNNQISNRKMFLSRVGTQGGIESMSLGNLRNHGYYVMSGNTILEGITGWVPTTPPESGTYNQGDYGLGAGESMGHIFSVGADNWRITSVTTYGGIERPLINNIIPGSQTLAGATEVHNAAEFQTALTAGQNIILENDIDLSSLGTVTNYLVANYSGNLEGNGYKLSNLNINGTGGRVGIIGTMNSGTISNLILDNINVNNSSVFSSGTLVGYMADGTLNNIAVLNSSVNSVSDTNFVGGLTGWQNNGTISNCSTDTNITGTVVDAGGIAGVSNGAISYSRVLGDINVAGSNGVGGLIGVLIGGGVVNVDHCYSTGNITNTGVGNAGGLVGGEDDDVYTLTSCYATGNISAASGHKGGLIGGPTSETTINNSVWDSTTTGCADAQGSGEATLNNTAGLTTAQMNDDATVQSYLGAAGWDYSPTGYPILSGTTSSVLYQYTAEKVEHPAADPTPEEIEEGLRNGSLSLARDANQYTQDPITIDGSDYEEVDWRKVPCIFDELYAADDLSAETRYDNTISEINAQDKKLQLEQTSIEVQYKAITSEREAVKKILDTNAQSSFKYFS